MDRHRKRLHDHRTELRVDLAVCTHVPHHFALLPWDRVQLGPRLTQQNKAFSRIGTA